MSDNVNCWLESGATGTNIWLVGVDWDNHFSKQPDKILQSWKCSNFNLCSNAMTSIFLSLTLQTVWGKSHVCAKLHELSLELQQTLVTSVLPIIQTHLPSLGKYKTLTRGFVICKQQPRFLINVLRLKQWSFHTCVLSL